MGNPVWSQDGRELFFKLSGPNPVSGVEITTDPSVTWSDQREVPATEHLAPPGVRNFDISPDGERFIIVFPAEQTEAGGPAQPQINIVLNWFTELRERVPVD